MKINGISDKASYRHIAGAVSETWFALGVQASNYIFVIREQYLTKPDICTSLILEKKNFSSCLTMG